MPTLIMCTVLEGSRLVVINGSTCFLLKGWTDLETTLFLKGCSTAAYFDKPRLLLHEMVSRLRMTFLVFQLLPCLAMTAQRCDDLIISCVSLHGSCCSPHRRSQFHTKQRSSH